MGFILSITLLVGVFFGARWIAQQFLNERAASVPADAQARLRERRAALQTRYARRHSGPRVHREAFKAFIPSGLVILSALVLTLVLAQDPIAFVLMLVGCAGLGGVVFLYFNREARAAYNDQQDSEDFVSTSVAVLDDFVIPEDWNRKYLG